MRRLTVYTLLAVFALALSLHGKVVDANKEGIIIGMYSGMCDHDCSTVIRITRQHTYLDNTTAFMQPGDYNYFDTHTGVMLPDWIHEKVKALLDIIPFSLVSYPNRIGCPDCQDDGGLYLKIDKQQWFIERDVQAPELKVFVAKMEEALNIASGYKRNPF